GDGFTAGAEEQTNTTDLSVEKTEEQTNTTDLSVEKTVENQTEPEQSNKESSVNVEQEENSNSSDNSKASTLNSAINKNTLDVEPLADTSTTPTVSIFKIEPANPPGHYYSGQEVTFRTTLGLTEDSGDLA